MSVPHQNMTEIPAEIRLILERLRENGHEAYIIGGCVRDSILGNQPKDYDVTTSALPEETERVFRDHRVIETGLKHGTVTVLVNKTPVEITTYRIDSDYSDNRRPDSVTFTKSLEEDTSRRDFTMNAIAVDESGNIKDFHGGIDDINNKIIRCVGDPDKRFSEDALRILRAVRFSSVLAFNIEEKTKAAIFRNKDLLKNISRERIAGEFVKLLCGKNAGKIITEYIDVIGVFIPEALPMKGFDQKNYHHIYDVLEHTAHAVDNAPTEPILRLAAFLHDIGKPSTFTVKDGIGHFYGHAAVSAQMSRDILNRLKFDNYTKDTVIKLVKLHDGQIAETETAIKRFMNRHSPEIFFMLLQLKRADNLAQAPQYHTRTEMLDRLRLIAEDILGREDCFSLKQLAVNGKDLIEIGYKPGRDIGDCLSFLLDSVITQQTDNDKETLLQLAKNRLK